MRHTVESWSAAALALMIMLTACSTTPSVPRRIAWEFELEVVDDTGRRMRFLVDRMGVLSYGGGRDALVDRYSWSGRLSDEQLADVEAILAECNWLEGLRTTSSETTPRRTVSLTRSERRRRVTIAGASPPLEALQSVLHGASLARHEGVLDQLPKAGAQP